MANHASLTVLFTDIANAIRAKTGSADSIVADNFPAAIAAIPTGSTIPDGDNMGYGYAIVGNAMVGTAIVGGGGAIVGTAIVGTTTL